MPKCKKCGLEYSKKSNNQKYCHKCGIINRKEHSKKYKKEWYIKNRDRLLLKAKKYIKDNKEIIKLRNKTYYEKNKHKEEFMIKIRNLTKKNYQKNKMNIRLYGRKYNVKKRYNLGWEDYLGLTKKCKICSFDKIVDLHHIDGNKKNNEKSNLMGLCPNHHFLIHKKGYTLKQLKEEFKDGKI